MILNLHNASCVVRYEFLGIVFFYRAKFDVRKVCKIVFIIVIIIVNIMAKMFSVN